jgi:hypothetical protein
MFLSQTGLDATNWRAELATRGHSAQDLGRQPDLGRSAGASYSTSVCWTRWQQGQSALLNFSSQLLRGAPFAKGLPRGLIAQADSLQGRRRLAAEGQ